MTNPFYVDPMADYSRGLSGLSQSVQQVGKQKREDEIKAKSEIRYNSAKTAFQEAAKSGDADQIADAVLEYPELSKAFLVSQGIRDKGKADEASSFMKTVLTADESDIPDLYKERIQSVKGRGGNVEQSAESYMRWASNPKSEIKNMELVLASTDPEGYKALVKQREQQEVDYSPLQDKVAAEGIDPNSPEGHKRAKELNQRAATDPSLRPSDQKILSKANDAQLLSAGFANRANASNVILSGLESKKGFDASSLGASLARSVPGGNYVISQDHQDYFQAKEDFITAVLRKESGAVISDSEFEREDRKYFPQPGDKKSVKAQKAKARERAFDNLRNASKGVYDVQKRNPNLYGDSAESAGSKDQQALDWAKSNPNDPRVKKILELQGK